MAECTVPVHKRASPRAATLILPAATRRRLSKRHACLRRALARALVAQRGGLRIVATAPRPLALLPAKSADGRVRDREGADRTRAPTPRSAQSFIASAKCDCGCARERARAGSGPLTDHLQRMGTHARSTAHARWTAQQGVHRRAPYAPCRRKPRPAGAPLRRAERVDRRLGARAVLVEHANRAARTTNESRHD